MDPRAALAGALRGRSVLVVERHPAAADSIAASLSAFGLTVVTAGSGPEALLRLARDGEAPFGLVVLAADLPGMGAAVLERALRGRPETRAVPVAVLAGPPPDPSILLGALPGGTGAASGLDLEAASARLGLPVSDLAELLRAFAPQAEAHLAAIERAGAAGDAAAAQYEAHALAGAAGNLGATALHGAARALEHAIRSGAADLAAPLAAVAREGRAALAAIAALVPPGSAFAPAADAPAPAPDELADRRVLIVDDVRSNVDLLARALQGHYQLSVAFDGESALREVAAHAPDLILLDVMMPGLDGHEVCRRLKGDAATRDIPVVFLSSLDEGRDKAAGFEAGAADYITKPFEILEVKARVRALLRAKAYQDAVRELLESELRVAREIQRGLVPRDFAALGAAGIVDCAACLEPARAVGGDLYDVFRLDDDRLCLVMGDVSGKGIPAALFMVMTLTLIRGIARLSGRPAEILARVNEALAADNPSSMFVTLFCGVLEQSTGRLTCASGGHLSPLLVRRGEAPRPALAAEGTLVGVLPGATFPAAEVALAPGDLLVAYTDGVTEARNPEDALFGEPRLLALLEGVGDGAADEAVAAILAGVREFAGSAEQADDIAILAVRYAGPPGASAAAPGDLALDLHATLDDLGRAAAAVRAFCEARGVAREPTDDLLLGLDEMMANVITYAYRGDPDGVIVLRLHIAAEAMTLEIRDRGPAFDPLKARKPDLELPLDARPEGGLGIHLARSVIDAMAYERVGDQNRLRLTRSLVRRTG
jgi:sigma-B regulation protein RsbU (phosphoserine phosphatase)